MPEVTATGDCRSMYQDNPTYDQLIADAISSGPGHQSAQTGEQDLRAGIAAVPAGGMRNFILATCALNGTSTPRAGSDTPIGGGSVAADAQGVLVAVGECHALGALYRSSEPSGISRTDYFVQALGEKGRIQVQYLCP
ncbi:hypothetical protein OG935_06095 [Nocardia cyriacigeorgica]|uniref:hypothetical protein n=1 Tax=Nocardia cyriacigeorgica TaxID=135487 RepID=UPI0015E3DB8C|nr:hypothetical protein [Nocardia cyriacigeorgica]